MRLIRAKLTNFRGIESSTVEFSDGVTIVEGPNEIGKSSIAEAINLLRTAKASSKTQQIRSIKPVGKNSDPEAEIELRTGDYRLTFWKRWSKKGETTLTIHEPHPAQLTGDEAHDRYIAILEETIDKDLLSALEVVQGDSLDQATLANIPTLQRALGDGEDVPEGTDSLMQKVDEEFARYFTKTERPTGEYKDLAARREELLAEVSSLEESSREMDRLVQDHEAALRRQAQLDGQIEENARELTEARDAREGLRDLRDSLEKAQHQHNAAQRAVEDAKQVSERRAQRVEEVSGLTSEINELETTLTDLRQHQEQTTADREAAKLAHDEADKARRTSGQRLAAARSTLEALEALATYTRLKDRLEKAEEADGAKRDAEKELARETITKATLTKLRELDTAFRVAQQAKQSAAPRVTIERLGEAPVEVDGVTSTERRQEVLVDESLEVRVPGVVSVHVDAGHGDAAMNAKLTSAESALATALADAGVESLSEAEAALARREEAERALDRATTALADRLAGTSLEELRDEVRELAEKIDHVDDSLSRDDARAHVRRLEELVATQEAAADEASATAERTRARAETADKKLLESTVTLEGLERQLAQASERLDKEREDASDEALARRAEESESALEDAVELVRVAKTALDAAEPEFVELRFTNAQELAESHAKARQDQRDVVVKLRTQLDAKVDDGIYDRLTDARAELEVVTTSWQRLDRSARAVKLLRETLTRHRDEAQKQYVAPFTERINTLGRLVFGSDFQVHVTPDLRIESRTLHGRTVAFEYLSAGAREQLALLGRLACAQLIDADEGAPILLDDTLGFADPARLERLNLVLNEVGRTAQVVVLTCQPERFDKVGGATRQTLGAW